MKTIKTDPGAKRLMESLRNMGYDCSTAIADIVDNSIAADASEIYIDIIPKQDPRMDHIPKKEYHPAAIIIADNGKGMDRDELHEAMRFGTLQEYSLSDLGKYGLGLKTASLSQCRILTVLSKARSGSGVRPRRHCMRWDIDHVYETNEWDLLVPEEHELEPWEKEILDQIVAKENGTVVLWTNLEGVLSLLSSSDIRERERFLAHLIEEVGGHLRMIFHRFMQGSVTGRRKLDIAFCGTPLIPWDPFCRNEKTEELEILPLQVILTGPDGSKLEEAVTISPFVLPKEDEFSSQVACKEASGPKNWNQQQGFYFYRNNRLLQAGGWSRLRTIDEHTKLLRVAVDFSGELDRAFAINITKMRAGIPAEIRTDVESNVAIWVKIARARYDNPSSKNPYNEQQNQLRSSFDPKSSMSDTNISDHDKYSPDGDGQKKNSDLTLRSFSRELDEMLIANEGKWDIKKFSDALMRILEAVSEGRMIANQIPMHIIKKIYRDEL